MRPPRVSQSVIGWSLDPPLTSKRPHIVWIPPRAEPCSSAEESEEDVQHVINGNLVDLHADQEFLNRAQHGDHAAFTQLVERYRPILIRFCQCYLKDHHRAEEAAQVTLTRAWINIGDCHGEFRPWLLKIAKNHTLDELRKAEYKRTVQFLPESAVEEIASTQEPLDEVVALRLDLFAAVKCLPPPYRAVVNLRIAGEDYPAVAQRLGIRACTARKRFERAMKLLRIVLARSECDYSNVGTAQRA